MNRYEAQQRIINQLKRIDGRTSPWDASYTFSTDLHDAVVPHDEYIGNINSFPFVMCVFQESQIRHVGGGERLTITSFRIRGITWDEDVEFAGELLADDIEHVLNHVRLEHPEFDEIRLTTIATDEGLNAPLAAVVIEGTLVYQNA